MGVGKEIGCEGYIRRKRMLFAFLGRQSHKIEAKELIGMYEIVGGQQDSCLIARSGLSVNLAHRAQGYYGNSQLSEHPLSCVSIVYWLLIWLLSWRYRAEPNHVQSAAQRPSFWEVILNVDELCPQALTCVSYVSDDFLDGGLVDKVV